ncbi:MAG TPA: hypothetical protein DFR83_09725 [Deltaproteobacteria bacterium]|nr:hypothetical protein [Deltaproteobacteria bacterium]
MSRPDTRWTCSHSLLFASALALASCVPTGDDKDTAADSDTSNRWTSSGGGDDSSGDGGGSGGGGDGTGGASSGGASDGGTGDDDALSPRIVDGYAGYSDAGALGIVAVFTVEVEDPDDDILGGIFRLTLNDNEPYLFPIDNDTVDYNPSTGNVSLTFSNVEPEYYRVRMRVDDQAGNASNIWTGEMAWR